MGPRVGVGHEADRLHVQLLGDDGAVALTKGLALDVHGGEGLADLHGGVVPGGPAQGHDGQNLLHVLFEVGVDQALVRHGEVAEMHAKGRVLLHPAHHVLIDALRHEGHEGGADEGQLLQHRVEGHVGRLLVGG